MSTEFPKQQTHDWILETGLLLGWWETLFWSCPNHCWWFLCTWWGLSRCWWGCWLWRRSWWQCCRGRWSWRRDQCIWSRTPVGREFEFSPIFPCTTWMWWSSEILCQWQRSETRLLQFWTHSFPFWPDISGDRWSFWNWFFNIDWRTEDAGTASWLQWLQSVTRPPVQWWCDTTIHSWHTDTLTTTNLTHQMSSFIYWIIRRYIHICYKIYLIFQ